MKRMAIGAIGTRGDVSPAIALGAMLSGGCEVILAAPPENREAAERAGLEFLPVGDDFASVVARGGLGRYREQIRLQFRACLSAFEGADAIVGFSLFYAGGSLAERAGASYDHVFFTPQVFRSARLPPPSARDMDMPPRGIESAWRRHEAQENFILKALINDERKALGLGPVARSSLARDPARAILAIDEIIARPPEDAPGVRQAHFWRLPGSGEQVPAALARFLDEGGPPVLLTLGSVSRAERGSLGLLRKAAASLLAAGERAVLVHPDAAEGGPAGDGAAVGRAIEVRFAPFGAVLPRCAAIAHQGGIGTLFEAALAGIPQAVLPCMLDQYFWARRIEELGIGRSLGGPRALADRFLARRIRAIAEEGSVGTAVSGLASALASPERARSLRARVSELFGVPVA
jgi:vancomycin aglycone glucosyltransferase